jgi:hypothetical protein
MISAIFISGIRFKTNLARQAYSNLFKDDTFYTGYATCLKKSHLTGQRSPCAPANTEKQRANQIEHDIATARSNSVQRPFYADM